MIPNSSAPQPNSWAFPLALCLLGPVLYVTLAFSMFAALPGLYLSLGLNNPKQGRLWNLCASILGSILCYVVMGQVGLGYIFLAALPSLLVSEALHRNISPEGATLLSVGVISAIATIFFLSHLQQKQLTPEKFAKIQMARAIDWFEKNQYPQGIDKDQIKELAENPKDALHIIPGKLLAIAFIICALPLILLLRWNPKGLHTRLKLPRNFIRQWRLPDALVWFVVFCVAFQALEVPYLTGIARNMTDSLVVLYFLQGMSILAYFLDVFRVKGLIRSLIYGIAILFLNPMVVSFGFLDLWFNFRDRYRDKHDSGRQEES